MGLLALEQSVHCSRVARYDKMDGTHESSRPNGSEYERVVTRRLLDLSVTAEGGCTGTDESSKRLQYDSMVSWLDQL